MYLDPFSVQLVQGYCQINLGLPWLAFVCLFVLILYCICIVYCLSNICIWIHFRYNSSKGIVQSIWVSLDSHWGKNVNNSNAGQHRCNQSNSTRVCERENIDLINCVQWRSLINMNKNSTDWTLNNSNAGGCNHHPPPSLIPPMHRNVLWENMDLITKHVVQNKWIKYWERVSRYQDDRQTNRIRRLRFPKKK